MTLKDAFTKALLARGWTLVKINFKHDVYTHPESPAKLYLGRAGALRTGDTAASSRPCSEKFRQKLIEEARQ